MFFEGSQMGSGRCQRASLREMIKECINRGREGDTRSMMKGPLKRKQSSNERGAMNQGCSTFLLVFEIGKIAKGCFPEFSLASNTSHDNVLGRRVASADWGR